MNDFSIRRIKEGKEFLIYSETETGTKAGLMFLREICKKGFVSDKLQHFPCNRIPERWGIRCIPKYQDDLNSSKTGHE
ncbi:MAG: hypothetical protein M0P12_03335 [Paludibacteraceae bacterium]|nr:hypothetical protein [Paludibacteraceae bacterium]